ncbi:MAG: glycosyltransferase family 1 protein [PVC group bacterium]
MCSLRIGIDARWIFPRISGVGRVTEKLIHHLGKIDRRNHYFLFFSDPGVMDRYARRWERYPNLQSVPVPWGIFSLAGQIRIPSLIRKLGLDVFHSTNYFLPLFISGTRTVSTIHDLIPLKFPHFTPRAKKTRFHWIFRRVLIRCARRSDRIIAVSNHTRDDLTADLGVEGERIAVVYNGIDEQYRPLPEAESIRFCAEKLGSADPFLLYVGRFDPYKNVPGLIRAFAAFCRTRSDRPRLVLAGPPDPRYPEARETVSSLGLGPRVTFLDGVDEEDLIPLYNGARILVLPSFYEGFGLPPLEAMACGTPVISSNRGSLPEIVGGAALLIDPGRDQEIAGAIEKLWDSEPLREELRKKGLARAREFSWEKTARETLAVYESLVE